MCDDNMPTRKPGGTIKVMLEMGMPSPALIPVQTKPQVEKVSVEERVRDALELIDSGHDSTVEWSMLTRLHKSLKALKKPNNRAKNIIKMIEPVLNKYGYHTMSEK